jgi:multisubunit Na+/H+ antiporter MnhE subunit
MVIGMLLLNFTWGTYVTIFLISFFFMVVDGVITNINARFQFEYYRSEILPWVRWAYKNKSFLVGLLLSMLCGLGIFVAFILLPIRLTWIVFLFGFWFYRVFHSSMKLYYNMRRKRQ